MAERDREGQPRDVVDIPVPQKMLSAVSGSVLTSILSTPLDIVRVRLQAHQVLTDCCRETSRVQNQSAFCIADVPWSSHGAYPNQAMLSDCAAKESERRSFNSTLDGLRKIARNEGVWTLWRGLSPTLAMTIPANVIYFAGYDWLRTSPTSPITNRVDEAYMPLVAGSVARVLAAFAVSPIEMLRTRMQSAQTTGPGVLRATLQGLRQMASTQGYTSLWRGLSLTMWRDVPFSALYWWAYEYGRDTLHGRRRRSNLADHAMTSRQRCLSDANLTYRAVLVDSFAAGAASGAVAALVTTPFDVGKTRQQTLIDDAKPRGKPLPENRSMPRFLWHIYRTQGTAGLFKGWAARCLKVAPSCAIMISSYELGKTLLCSQTTP